MGLIGDGIKTQRHLFGMSKHDLAVALNVQIAIIKGWETETLDISASDLKRILGFFNCSLSDLLSCSL